MMDWGGTGWGWGAWLAMSLFMIAFWAVIAWALVTVVRAITSRPQSEHRAERPEQSAEAILAERFARGEIDQDDYTQRREALRR